MKERLSRRTFLRGAGGIAIALPFLDVMGEPGVQTGRAAAQSGGFPKRFLVFFSPNGTIQNKWEPYGGETDFSFTSGAGAGETRILAPLEDYRDRLIVLNGLAAKSRDHGPGSNGHDKGMGHMLTCAELVVGPSGVGEFSHLPDGTAGGISIDQEIANLIGNDTKFRSLEFGVKAQLDTARQLTSRMCYRDSFQVLPPENDPAQAFNSIFGEFSGPPEVFDILRAKRLSVLDKVMDDITRLDSKLGPADKQKLDQHLTAIRDVESTLQSSGELLDAPGCMAPDAPSLGDPLSNDNFPATGKAQMDLMVMALACDLTRTASIQWSTAQSGTRFTWLGVNTGHHSISHEADDSQAAADDLTALNHWYAQQFHYLIDSMAKIPEGDGTLLDNTVVMWVNEQGNGDKHSLEDIPFVLAGGAGMPMGRYLQYPGVSQSDLYVSLLNHFGNDTDVFGLPEVCTGPLTGLL